MDKKHHIIGRWVQARGFTIALCLIGAVLALGFRAYSEQADARCKSINGVIALMDEMIIVATEDENSALDVERVKQLPEFQALDENDKAFWIVILTGLSSDDGTSARDQLRRFADERIQPLAC